MHISPVNNITYRGGYSKENKVANKGKKSSISKKTEAMLLASMMSLAALANCDIESTSSSKTDISWSEKEKKEDKKEQLYNYDEEYEKRSQVLYTSAYGRIRTGDTSKGYKRMSTLAHNFSPIVFEKPLKITPYLSIGKIYKFNVEEGSSGEYLLESKDPGDATFNRVAAIGVKAEYIGFYVKASSTELYSSYREEDMFSHAGAAGYKCNLTDKLALDVAYNVDFTVGKGALDGKEYNRSIEGNIVYKISDNANIKLGVQKTIKKDNENDIDFSANFTTTF